MCFIDGMVDAEFTAYLEGLPAQDRRTVEQALHGLRHALIPLVTLSGFIFANLLGGTVIIESLFSQQGIGRLMADATNGKDVPVVLAIVLLAAATYVVVHLIVDILNGIIDPRQRAH